jgi:hypothetical protein
MTDIPDGVYVSTTITDGWIHHSVALDRDAPACVISIAVSPEAPNALHEFMILTGMFLTEEFVDMAARSLDEAVRETAVLLPEDTQAQALVEAFGALRRQGLSEDDARALIDHRRASM